jgi:hypothetical protein
VYEEEEEQAQEKRRRLGYSERASARWREAQRDARGTAGGVIARRKGQGAGRRRRQNRAAQKVKLVGSRAHRRPNPLLSHTLLPVATLPIFFSTTSTTLSLSHPLFLVCLYFFWRISREGLDGSGRCLCEVPSFSRSLPFSFVVVLRLMFFFCILGWGSLGAPNGTRGRWAIRWTGRMRRAPHRCYRLTRGDTRFRREKGGGIFHTFLSD